MAHLPNKLQIFIANGGWSAYASWTCSTSSPSTRIRYRNCTNPAPANGGANCPGPEKESQSCSTAAKPICHSGVCACEKTVGMADIGDGTTQGSCIGSMQACYKDGSCKSKK